MSVKLFKLFVNTFRRNVPRLSITSGNNQLRFVTAMDIDKKNEEIKDETISNKLGTRYQKRKMWGRRTWEEGGRKQEDGESDGKKLCEQTVERIKKKKMVLLLGYCGVDYYGMQRNPGVPTIEEELLKALHEANYITDEDFKNQQNFQFQRSSRTDKGVSAARQIVSLKLPLESNIEEINKRLPACIRVFGIKRVTNKFNSKIKCNARTYSYTLPTYVFEPSAETPEQRKKYRITSDKFQLVNNVLSAYKGTRNYHNFTEKKWFQDPSSCRYMMSFNIHKVFVESEMEFAVLLVKGQSFMLHQIRKMVGLLIAVVRGTTDRAMMERAFGREKVMTPRAPGLGLVLDTVHFDSYDKKHQESHVSLTWEEQEEEIQKFIHQYIYPVIVKGEIEDHNMATWIVERLNQHSFEPTEEDLKNDNNKATNADDDDDDDGAGGDDDEDDNGDKLKNSEKNTNSKENKKFDTMNDNEKQTKDGVKSKKEENNVANEVLNEKCDVDSGKSENSIELKANA